MTEIEILRGMAILIALGKYIIPALIVGAIWEECDKRKMKKAKKLLAKRKAQFARECEIAGRRMHNIDKIHRTVHNFNKHQKITCKGHFTGSDVEAYIAKV